jgi:hypothetical protein
VKNIFIAAAVAVVGFILLNIAFFLDFLFQSLIDTFVALFTHIDFNMTWHWFAPIKHAMFVVVIGLISWPIFHSKLRVLFKAVYMTVPLAVVFVTIGMFLYRSPLAAYTLGGLFSLSVLYYLYRTKQPWVYYYTVILVSLTLLLVELLGVEI